MSRFNVILLIALIFSSVSLIRVSHEARRLFNELDRARTEDRVLESDYERLKSEKQSQATPLRVEKAARDRLAMRSATPAVTMYLNDISQASAPATEAAR